MRIQLEKVFRVVLAVIAICSISQASIAIQETQIQQGTAAKEEGVTSPLSVADIMPASKSLSGRFSALKTSLASLATDRHLSALEEELSKTQRVVDAFSDRLQALKAAKRYNYEELATFKAEIFSILTPHSLQSLIYIVITLLMLQIN